MSLRQVLVVLALSGCEGALDARGGRAIEILGEPGVPVIPGEVVAAADGGVGAQSAFAGNAEQLASSPDVHEAALGRVLMHRYRE